MPLRKHPQPFWRKQTNCYYVQIGVKQYRLAPDREEAYRLYHELMSRSSEERRSSTPSADPSVLQLIDDFLEWVQCNRSVNTYEIYRCLLQVFARSLPQSLTVAALKTYHVSQVMDSHAETWSQNTKHDFATTVQRALNWALKQGRIDRNPIAYLEKPPREAREMAVGLADYAEVMAAVAEPNFRDLLELAWETGGRPQELRAIEARHVDRDGWRVVFSPRESKGKRSHRVIYLGTDRAREIVRRLCDTNPQGPLLLNSHGRPWTKDSINCAFVRLQKKLGRKFHLGAWRKGFATEALKHGVDTVTLAHLMGHSNPTMISRVYGRVQQDPAYMSQAARRAKGIKEGLDAGDGAAGKKPEQ